MNDETKETVKFQSKDEIARCILALTPFCDTINGQLSPQDNFAMVKIKELTRLL